MDTHEDHWRRIFDGVINNMYDEIRETINWLEVQGAPERHWMWMSYTGLLIAQKFGVPVHFLSLGASCSFFPLWSSPNYKPNQRIVTFAFVNKNHFINITLDGDYPMAAPNGMWTLYRAEEAKAWEAMFEDRIARYKSYINSNTSGKTTSIYDVG